MDDQCQQDHAGRDLSEHQDILQASDQTRRKRRRLAAEDTPDPSRIFAIPAPIDDGSDSAGDEDVAHYRSLTDPINFWREQGHWPPEFFEPGMERVFAQKRPSLARKRSNSATSSTPSDQKPREEKSAQYRDSRYDTLLATKGSFMVKSGLDVDIESASKSLYRELLEKQQPVPEHLMFRDDIFESTCAKINARNEARVIQDISRLIVPSAETLATFGAKHLDILIESDNEGWNNSVPFIGTRPQPDYSVGFRRESFTKDQLAKLSPFIGDFIAGDLSLFMATYYMHFPFLTCEVECGAGALDVADRQNAHSMTLPTRAIVELFRLVKRENELHRQILAFSISHDHRTVRIHGHYPVIQGKETMYYRHLIREFSFIELDGRDKWASYRFTKNVYDVWMPEHFKRICSAIDQLPSEFDWDNQPPSGPTSQVDAHTASLPVQQDSQSGDTGQHVVPLRASPTGQGSAKRRRSPVKKISESYSGIN